MSAPLLLKPVSSQLHVAKAWWEGCLLAEACRPYRRAGLFAYFFAQGKFGRDPVYRAILEHGLLSGRTRILDLGCGQALLTAWLQAAGAALRARRLAGHLARRPPAPPARVASN